LDGLAAPSVFGAYVYRKTPSDNTIDRSSVAPAQAGAHVSTRQRLVLAWITALERVKK
jgi:hypothetical protein